MRFVAGLFVALSLAASAGRATSQQPVAAALSGDPSHSASAAGWVRTELSFGLGPAGARDGLDEGAVLSAWKQKTGDPSVLRVTQSAQVSL